MKNYSVIFPLFSSSRNGKYGNVTGTARPASPSDQIGKAEFIVAFNGIPCRNVGFIRTYDGLNSIISVQDAQSDAEGEPNYRVVSTDYDNYAIVYNCKKRIFLTSGKLINIK